jgi:hypothetical protein
MEILGLGVLALMPIFLATGIILDERSRRARFRDLARRLRLEEASEQRWFGKTTGIQGQRDGLLIRITLSREGDPSPPLHIVLDTQGRIPQAIELRSEDLGTGLAKRFGRKEVEIGDGAFDDAVFVRGPELALQAALDPETRLLVRELLRTKGRVADGAVFVQTWSSLRDTAVIEAAIEKAMSVARHLADPEDLVSRLCERFRWETSPGVRLRLLDLVADRFPAEPQTRAVFQEALLATSDDLRLRAARVLGEEGRKALLEIAAYTDGDNSQAVRAIELLGRRLPLDRALELLNDALRASHRNVARALMQTLGLYGGPTAIARLAVVLAVGDVDPAVAAARALAATGDASAEAPLLGALRAAHPDVALAVCEALGTVGSTAAVAPLRGMADNATMGVAAAIAARRAIGAIHARTHGASPGQVSLADAESGQLALAEDARSGRLTIAPK